MRKMPSPYGRERVYVSRPHSLTYPQSQSFLGKREMRHINLHRVAPDGRRRIGTSPLLLRSLT
jgi:hypothetical protein